MRFAIRALLLVVVVLFVGACGSDGDDGTELTIADTEPSATLESAVETQDGPVAVRVADEPPGDELPAPAAAAVGSAAANPAVRQRSQSVGGVTREASEPVQAVDESSSHSEEPVIQKQDQQATTVADQPSEDRFDVPVFPAQSSESEQTNIEPTDTAAVDGPVTTTRSVSTVDVPDLAAEDCGGSCENGGLDVLDDVLAPSDVGEVGGQADGVASLEPGVEATTTTTVASSDADDVCPPDSAPDCVEPADDAGTATSADTSGPNDPDAEATSVSTEPPDAVTCRDLPWTRGCDTPVPAPEVIEPAPEVSSTPRQGGIDVPQEIQDLLLAPIND